MNNSAAKVGEIFREAGTAFNKLSEMTLMLQPTDDSPPGGKWSDAEVEMLRGCINRFAVELNKISQHIKNRTMRHRKYLFEMDFGTIQDDSNSSQHLSQEPQPTQELTPETEAEYALNETFVNIFSRGFPEVKDEEIDQFLRRFDPSIVNATPPENFMEEDRSQQQAASEFEDLQDSSYDRTLQAVPILISLLDADVNNANQSEQTNRTESAMANLQLHAGLPNFACNLGEATGASRSGTVRSESAMANIGTLHAELPNFACNLGEATGASRSGTVRSESAMANIGTLHAELPNFACNLGEATGASRSGTVRAESAIANIGTLHAELPNFAFNLNEATGASRSGTVRAESAIANIGTLHAELPNFAFNLSEATGASSSASSNIQDVNYNYTSLVSREEHFSMRQAHDTWNYVSSPATNQTMGALITSEDNFILPSTSQTTSVQASYETETTGNKSFNESQYRPHDTVSSSLMQNTLRPGSFNNYSLPNNPFRSVQTPNPNLMGDHTDTQKKYTAKPGDIFYPGFFKNHGLFGNSLASNINIRMPQEMPRNNIFSPGPFSSLNKDPFRNVQAPNHTLENGGSTNMTSFTNLFGSNLFSANPDPVTNFSSVRANTNKRARKSKADSNCGCEKRRRSHRRRGGPAARVSADPIISPTDESTAGPSHSRTTRSRRRQAHYEIDEPDNKRSRKKATTKVCTVTSTSEAPK